MEIQDLLNEYFSKYRFQKQEYLDYLELNNVNMFLVEEMKLILNSLV